MSDSVSSRQAFPIGRRFLASFPEFRFEVYFRSARELTWTRILADGGPGASETVAINVEPVCGAVFVVSWQELNRTTVVAVQDFGKHEALTHITRADQSFLRARGSLREVP